MSEIDYATRMNLIQLMDGLPIWLHSPVDNLPDIADITEDSREVKPGSLFVARQGELHDGCAYITDARERGAVAVLIDQDSVNTISSDDQQAIPILVAENLNDIIPILADRFFDQPSRTFKLVGITGTNGKTTTTFLLAELLNLAGMRTGRLGTIDIHDGCDSQPTPLTTLPAIELTRHLAHMRDVGCDAVVMEVSSHALEQGRVAALDFDVALFTNLSGDHLDYHQTMTAYADAKAVLFDSLVDTAAAIVNVDDDYANRMMRDCKAKVIGCSLNAVAEDACRATVIDDNKLHPLVKFDGPWGSFESRLQLAGRHNCMNLLQAVATAFELGVPIATIAAAIATCSPPPGRLQSVSDMEQDDISVFVDYAHTDAALENVLQAARPLVDADSQLWVVFGCGGDRDRRKRPRMAAVACANADRIVITSDNPRTEVAEQIVADVETGVPSADLSRCVSIVDRAAAIDHAVASAQQGDVIVIAGKGHEDYQIIGRETVHFDDSEVAADALAARRKTVHVV